MAKTRRSSNKNTDVVSFPQSLVVATRIRPAANCSEDTGSRPTWVLLWKTKCDRRETTVLVGFLSPDGDRQLKDYQETIEKLKLNAKETGCSCLTDSLDIVKMKGDYQDHTTWWNQFFDSDQQSDINHYQLMHFSLDGDGKKKDDHFQSKIGKDTDWSLLLHRINNCNSIEEIVRSGIIPDHPSDRSMEPSNHSAASNNANNITNNNNDDSETSESFLELFSLSRRIQNFVSNNSLTILHFRNLYSSHLSSIAFVRCIRAFRALRNNVSIRKEEKSSNNNHFSCSLCSKPCLIPSRTELSTETVARWNVFLSTLFDLLFGLLVCAALLFIYSHQSLVRTLYLDVKLNAFQCLEDQIAWLETFPAGFKLNVQLTHNMGQGILSLLHRQKKVIFATLWDPQGCQEYLIPTLATLAALGGWTTFLAILVDLWRLEIFHLILLAISFRKLYQAELYLLSALFRLFRGKKRNVLRQRTDSMKYDAMQLLAGTIAFCICVFLWTTFMVYYTFFVIWNLLMHLPILGCSVLYLLSRSIPWGSLFFRFLNPHWFPKDLYIKFDDAITINGNNNVQVSNLESILESPLHILFSRITIPLKRVFQWYLISFLEILYPRASHTTHSFLPLTLLVDDSKP